jgi:hypothetical protein
MALASKPRSVDDVLEFPPSHDPVLLSNKIHHSSNDVGQHVRILPSAADLPYSWLTLVVARSPFSSGLLDRSRTSSNFRSFRRPPTTFGLRLKTTPERPRLVVIWRPFVGCLGSGW